MDPDHWKKIERLYNDAVELPSENRSAFLAEACDGDDVLKSQVESLLEIDPDEEMFIESPAIAYAAKTFKAESPRIRNGDKINNYKILNLLGEGGMGEVFLAEDLTLRRKVALKMLASQFLADESSLKRLFREASLGSSLDHPNICTIHEIGESGGRHFIAMQYVEGRTIGELIDGRPLEQGALFSVGLQIADALRFAHSKGIIHRDIKPNNIVVDESGRVKVLDFGLAKLLLEDGSPAETNLTITGVIKGTPAYMSPEQARAEHVGFRSDMFSFGVVLYEMASGRLPFKKDSRAETMAAIINEPHRPIIDLNEKISPALSELIDRLLEKDPKDRLASMDDVVTCLREAAVQSGSLSSGDVPDGIVVPFTVPKRRFFRDMKRWIKRHKILAASAAALVILIAAGITSRDSLFPFNDPAVNSVAVMPFVNENGIEDVEYLSDGMTEALISGLSRYTGVSVKPRSLVYQYKGKNVAPGSVAADLKVNTIISGRLIQRGKTLTVYLSLVDAKTNSQIWGKQYDRQVETVAALQREMVRDIIGELRPADAVAAQERPADRSSDDPEAYDLYLKGRFHWKKRTPVDLQKAIEYFQKAVLADPEYANAYAGLADGYILLAAFGAAEPVDATPKARDAALKALSLDPDLPEAYVALGHISEYFDYDYKKAEEHFKRAIQLDPDYAIAHEFYGTLMSALGRHEEAEREFKTALKLEPLSLGTNRMYGEMLFFARRYDESIAQLKRTIELEESFASSHRSIARVYQATGNQAGHVAEYARYQELIGQSENARLMRASFKKGGWKGFLNEITRLDDRDYLPAYNLVPYYAEMGELDKAFTALDKTYDRRYYYIAWLYSDPLVDPLRKDPRFEALLRRGGFLK